MPPLNFLDARSIVLDEVRRQRITPSIETVPLTSAAGRILAEPAMADRDYPPFNRAMRDGFAVRHHEIPGQLRVAGEVRAGDFFTGKPGPAEAVEIMTGAPVPDGLDAVVMIEHCTRPSEGFMATENSIEAGGNVSPMGSEAHAGEIAIPVGTRIDHTVVAWLATIGKAQVQVYRQLRVAIIATGDELVDLEDTPLPHQIRNSNGYSLAAQVTRAGAIPIILPVARDTVDHTRELVNQGLEADLLLLSGGVSAGRYDVVEKVLDEMGAGFYFDRVLIQPGAPLVFGRVRQKFFFGLPGNPGSTITTFELFARAAIDLLSGASKAPLPTALGRLTRDFHHKGGLTRFLPAIVETGDVTPIDFKGSGDVPALARTNAFIIADPSQPHYKAGELIPILFK